MWASLGPRRLLKPHALRPLETGLRRRGTASAHTTTTTATTTTQHAHRTIRRIHDALADARETANEPVFELATTEAPAPVTLTLELGARGTYGLEALSAERIRLFSPVSGPREYAWDKSERWFVASDGHVLDELLVRELLPIYVNL